MVAVGAGVGVYGRGAGRVWCVPVGLWGCMCGVDAGDTRSASYGVRTRMLCRCSCELLRTRPLARERACCTAVRASCWGLTVEATGMWCSMSGRRPGQVCDTPARVSLCRVCVSPLGRVRGGPREGRGRTPWGAGELIGGIAPPHIDYLPKKERGSGFAATLRMDGFVLARFRTYYASSPTSVEIVGWNGDSERAVVPSPSVRKEFNGNSPIPSQKLTFEVS